MYARGGAAGGQLALADQGSGGGRAAGPARQARGAQREGKRGGGHGERDCCMACWHARVVCRAAAPDALQGPRRNVGGRCRLGRRRRWGCSRPVVQWSGGQPLPAAKPAPP